MTRNRYLPHKLIFGYRIWSPRNECTFVCWEWVFGCQCSLLSPSASCNILRHSSGTFCEQVSLLLQLLNSSASPGQSAFHVSHSCWKPPADPGLTGHHRNSLWPRYPFIATLFFSFTFLPDVVISYIIAISTETSPIFQYVSIHFPIYTVITKPSSQRQPVCWTLLRLFICCTYSRGVFVPQVLILSSAYTEKLLPWTLEGQLVKHLSTLPYSS